MPYFCGTLRRSLSASDDASAEQFLVDASALRERDGFGAAEDSAGSVTGRAEGLIHAALLTDEHPTRAAHVAWNEDRLPDRSVVCRNFGMPGRKRASRAFAMHPDFALFAADGVFFELGDVVGDVVHQAHVQVLPRAVEDRLEDFASLPHQ